MARRAGRQMTRSLAYKSTNSEDWTPPSGKPLVSHIVRPGLPWRETSKTYCGKDPAEFAENFAAACIKLRKAADAGEGLTLNAVETGALLKGMKALNQGVRGHNA